MFKPNQIVKNAMQGKGPCSDCPAFKTTKGEFVNPGFSSLEAKVMFVTQEPRHDPKWNKYKTWRAYNKFYTDRWFPGRNEGSRGGKFLVKNYLKELNLTWRDVWIGDSLKCKLKNRNSGKNLFNGRLAAKCCNKYLTMEIATINPAAIVTLGTPAAQRTLRALGVADNKLKDIGVTRNFGRSRFRTKWPVIISPHWAARIPHATYLKVVKKALHRLL